MGDPLKLTNIPAADPAVGVSRRVALQVLFGGVGGGLVASSGAAAPHPIHEHLSNPGAIEHAQQRAAAASRAGVPRRASGEDARGARRSDRAGIDRRQGRAVPRSAARRRIRRQSARVSGIARRLRHGRDQRSTARRGSRSRAAEQDALLRDASTAESTSALRGHFQNLKDWIAGAYYSSERGMRELGWTGNTFHP